MGNLFFDEPGVKYVPPIKSAHIGQILYLKDDVERARVLGPMRVFRVSDHNSCFLDNWRANWYFVYLQDQHRIERCYTIDELTVTPPPPPPPCRAVRLFRSFTAQVKRFGGWLSNILRMRV